MSTCCGRRAGYDQEIVATLSQQLSWSHFKDLLPVRTDEARQFYIDQAVAARLSVRGLRDLIGRQGFERKEIANAQTPGSGMVPADSFRDPYLLDFLGLRGAYNERDLEDAIVHDLQEAGNGWAFVARQKRVTIDNDDFYLDLLFYSRPLRRLIAVELKVGRFKAAFECQMKLYLKWLDRYERREDEEAPIGLILCTEASREQVELLEMHKDGIVVAEYWTALPPKAELEARIQLSEQPDEITKKIAPALFRTYPTVKTAFDSAKSKVDAANTQIKASVDEWFSLDERIAERTKEIQDLGDKTAITAERDRLQREVDAIKKAAELTDEEVAMYQEIAGQLDAKDARLREISIELDQLSSYVTSSDGATAPTIMPQTVQATVTVRPSSEEVPDATAMRVDSLKDEAVRDLLAKIESALVEAVRTLEDENAVLEGQIQSIKADNAELIAKHEANEESSSVVADHKKQVASLEEIIRRERSRDKLIADQKTTVGRIEKGITDRDTAWTTLETNFNAEERVLTDLTFGIEAAVTAEAVTHASNGISQRSVNAYVKNKGDEVSYQDAQADPMKFLKALRQEKVKLNKGFEPRAVATNVLTISKEVRFSAELDADHIGGFSRSSMTPGKQALFALTLILNESQEPWPLLVDQPEDDLDSRSIYETIVPYLMKRKKERQIIMVSHNANLVIGADSELVIVANRHGVDRKNDGDRTFEYFTGALEHSQPLNAASPTTLGRFGIREHACEILDGGEEAFQKRQEKYKIRTAG